MSVGTEIRRRRQEKGLTGAQLAARAGLAPSAVSQIETGKRAPSSTSIIKLAQALDIEPGDLFPKKAQAPLLLEEARRRGAAKAEEMLREADPLYTAYEAQGHVLAGVWRSELARWDKEIPAGTAPSELTFGQLMGWVLGIGQSRGIYEDVAKDAGLTKRKEMRDTLEMLRDVERGAVQMARRALEPAKTYAEFRKIWNANGMDALARQVERR